MALRKYHMHLNGERYEEVGEGRVRVTAADGRAGVFRCDGHWIEGDLREANLNMLVFCGGPTVPAIFNYRWPEVPADVNRSSGWPAAHEEYLIGVRIL
ncbi:MAG: hypothetical protein ACSLE1_12435 [Sphingobium sp.]